MSDMRNIERENKKKQLRSNIVPMPGNRTGSQTGGGTGGEAGNRSGTPSGGRFGGAAGKRTGHMAGGQPDPEEFDGDEMITRYRRKKFLRVFLVLFILAAALFIGYRYIYQHEFADYSVRWEKPMRYVDGGLENGAGTKEAAGGSEDGNSDPDQDPENPASEGAGSDSQGEQLALGGSMESTGAGSQFVQYIPFGENMIRYTKDGATYLDASGNNVWTVSYEMRTPIANVNGDYAVIADQQGNEIYICSTSGCTGVAKTQLPITKAAVSSIGVTAAVVEDGTASYVFYFRRDGEELGINIKMLLSGDGYPLDLALSPDGTQIVMSVVHLEGGVLKNKVVFYDFSEIGKNVNNRYVGGFEEEFNGKMAARVRYLNQDTVCAFSDSGLTFISVKNVIPDPEVITVEVEEDIESICSSERYAAMILDNPTGDPYRMDIYTTDGKLKKSIPFDYPYSGALIDGDQVILYNEESCMVYNIDGYKKFEGRFDFPVSLVRKGKKGFNSLIIAGSDRMQEISLR